MLAVVGALIVYEALALFRARARTPLVIEQSRNRPLALDTIPPRRLAMLLRVEDPGFFEHRGVDFSSPGQGMTTITQALVKRFYFDRFRPGFAKIEQSLIARFVLDPAMSKRDQLEVFVNHASFGDFPEGPIIGLEAAARHFYRRPFAELGDREFLSLVATLMAPNALDPRRHPTANAERVRRIEALLAGRCAPRGLRDVTYEDCAEPSARPVRPRG